MDNKIKKSYSKLKMTEDAKKRIYNMILETKKNDKNSGIDRLKHKPHNKIRFLCGWKTVLAACIGVLLIVTTGVYATGKISGYFSVNIDKEKYQAKINLDTSNKASNSSVSPDTSIIGEPEQYIQVTADFGDDYKLEVLDSMYSYSHKDGFDAGKDFYYEAFYMDIDDKYSKSVPALDLYDNEVIEDITVNSHKALLCKSNTVQGSKYISDYDTVYNINLFVFYPEYGYMVNYCCMQGLGAKKLISLAESAIVTETTKNKSVKYNYLSQYNRENANNQEETDGTNETKIISRVKKINQQVYDEGFLCKVTDVTVTSKVKDTDLTKYNSDHFTAKSGYWDKNGKLKPYVRENVETGDGVSTPKYRVSGTETVQPKMVYVTLEVEAKTGQHEFQLPEINFFGMNGQNNYNNLYYQNYMYIQNYNRPEKILDTITDFMPCYFKETSGGKSFWLKKMKKGSKSVFHFAYIVDGDMTGNMLLRFGYEELGEDTIYVDISQQ